MMSHSDISRLPMLQLDNGGSPSIELVLAAEIYKAVRDVTIPNILKSTPPKSISLSSGLDLIFKAAVAQFDKSKTPPLPPENGLIRSLFSAYKEAGQPHLEKGVVCKVFVRENSDGQTKTYANVLLEGRETCFELSDTRKDTIIVGDFIGVTDVKKIEKEKRLCHASNMGLIMPKAIKDLLKKAEPDYQLSDIHSTKAGAVLYGRMEGTTDEPDSILIHDRDGRLHLVKLSAPLENFGILPGDAFIAHPKVTNDKKNFILNPDSFVKLEEPFASYISTGLSNHIIGELWFDDSPPQGFRNHSPA